MKAIIKTNSKKKPALNKVTTTKTIVNKKAKTLTEDEKEYYALCDKNEIYKKEMKKNMVKMMALNSYIQSYYKEFNIGGLEDRMMNDESIMSSSMISVVNGGASDDSEKSRLINQFYFLTMSIQPMQDIIELGDKALEDEFKTAEKIIIKKASNQRESLRAIVRLEFFLERYQLEYKMAKNHLKQVEKEIDKIIVDIKKLDGKSEGKNIKSIN